MISCFFACLALAAQTPAPTASPTPTVYLTFDDGPLSGSEDINDAVKVERIKVNVFMVGQMAAVSPRLKSYALLYETNPWIETGNHSFSHAAAGYKAFYADPATLLADFQKNEKALHLSNKLARLPGRNMWRLKDRRLDDVKSGSACADLLFRSGFRVFGWDLEWSHDPRTGVPVQTVDDMAHLIEKHLSGKHAVTPNHLVLLCHDEMFQKPWEETGLKQLIDLLRAKGYRFGHLSEYP